ncbi:MAG TPA: mevalonate kinase [Chloroflexi bacterium]|nr:mevalonate kinase [Chloroflexota bacterium]
MISASAPGKVILFGEHAVVHGYTAAAIPLPAIRATSRINSRYYSLDTHIIAPMIDLDADYADLANSHPIKFTINLFYTRHPHIAQPPITISMESAIPISSGMGSGAAITASLLRGLFQFHQIEFSQQILSEMVYEVEKIHHGTPSGIDNTVVCFEQPVIFKKNQPLQTFSITGEAVLVIANSGHTTPTYETVADVRQKFADQPQTVTNIFTAIEETCLEGVQALQSSNFPLAGMSMRKNHQSLRDLGVSDPVLDRLVDTAIKAGAWGAKLSGGGRGGIIIALCSPERKNIVCDSLENAGGLQIMTTPIATDRAAIT